MTISLKTDSKVPLYEQIYAYIRGDIRSGRIPCGEKLPSTRALSRHLEVSRSTVELAYEQLLSEGYLESEPCRGYFAARIDDLYRLDRPERLERREQEPEKAPASCEEKENYLFDFTPNGVDVDSFPYNVWRKLSKDILKDNRTELFRTGDSKGEEGFRRAIASYLYQARGVECRPEQIIIGAGNDYMLMLLGTILGPDRKLAFEDPTYMQACRLFECLSYETVPVSMDKSGMRVDRLALTDADIAYVTPSHQYPTGIVMPVGRRQELLKWADQAENRYIIEDDYDSEFRYKGKPIPALQGMDAHGKVIYLGTFSRSVAPAIRLSYMVLPASLLNIYEKKNRFIHSTVSKVDQRIMERFLEEGYYERHLNKMRTLYRGRHDALIEALKPLSGICRISGEHAGVHLLLHFGKEISEEERILQAKEAGIRVYGLSDYRIRPAGGEEPAILLGYANLTEEEIKKAVELLIRCWQ